MVEERTEVSLRMQAELLALAPSLLAITGRADNLWFLNFLTCRADLRKLAAVRRATLLQIEGIGVKFAGEIARWQESAGVYEGSTSFASRLARHRKQCDSDPERS